MLLDDFVGDKQTQACAFTPLGGVEEGKHLFPGLFIHADTVVGDLEYDIILILPDSKDDFMRFFGIVPFTLSVAFFLSMSSPLPISSRIE